MEYGTWIPEGSVFAASSMHMLQYQGVGRDTWDIEVRAKQAWGRIEHHCSRRSIYASAIVKRSMVLLSVKRSTMP